MRKPKPRRALRLVIYGGLLILLVKFTLPFAGSSLLRQLGYLARFVAARADAEHSPETDVSARRLAETEPTPYWTGYHGPARNGVYDAAPIDLDWSSPPALLWEIETGISYGTVSLAKGLVYSLEQRGDDETLVAYRASDGGAQWMSGYPARFDEKISGTGPRGTPTWANDRIYTVGAKGDLVAWDAATGEQLWQHNLLKWSGGENVFYGISASPLVWKHLVIACAGRGSDAGTIFAFHAESGEQVWQSIADTHGYVSPMLMTLHGREQLVQLTGERILGIDQESGAEIWSYPWKAPGRLNCAQPVQVSDSQIFVSSGYGKGAALLELTPARAGLASAHRWTNRDLRTRFNPAMYFEGHVYGLDEGVLVCMRIEDGTVAWKKRGYGYGQILRSGSTLIIAAEDGNLCIVDATPEGWHERSRFQAVDGKIINSPAIADGRLYVRTQDRLRCFDVSAE